MAARFRFEPLYNEVVILFFLWSKDVRTSQIYRRTLVGVCRPRKFACLQLFWDIYISCIHSKLFRTA
jgi:hypothetical protein